MAYPGLAHEEHKYLGKEYCTGYTDDYGKWNTGFYCPQYGSKTAVFCCGTAVFKYCCTNQEPVDLSASNGGGGMLDGDDPDFDHPHGSTSSAVFVRVPIVFGVVCGIAAVLILLVVAAWYFCSCCFAYKKRRNDLITETHHHPHALHLNPHQGGLPGLYRDANGGNPAPANGAATLLNLYSPGTLGPLTTNSLVTTPLDLDWASSIASTYQSQQHLYAPLHFPPRSSPALSPAASAIAAALQNSPIPNSLLYGTTLPLPGSGGGTPSMISGSISAPSANSRLPVHSQAYQSLLNSSTSTTLSSMAQPQQTRTQTVGVSPLPPSSQSVGQLHRGNLPQQMPTTASIVNSYLASLQQTQQQSHTPPEQTPVPTTVTGPDRTRHGSPPPSYFQSVSSASSGYSSGRNSGRNSSTTSTGPRASRMATIQSILGGGGTGGNSYSNFSWSNEDDLLLADFLLRHENTLRRSLGLNNTANNRSSGSYNNASNNTTTTNNNINNNSRNRANPMLTQRELVELLLRLTSASSHSTTGTSIPRSDSRSGSDSNSTASSVITSRSTSSSLSSAGKLPSSNTSCNNNNKSVTISEVEEDNDDSGQDAVGSTTSTSGPQYHQHHLGRKSNKASLDLALSRISIENDSGVASSTCSTAGSEGAENGIGNIKVISRDLSEEAIKLKKQHALDDDGGEMTKMKFQQQLAATVHPEAAKCVSDGDCCGGANDDNAGGGTDGKIMVMESSTYDHTIVSGCNNTSSGGENVEEGRNNGSVILSTTLPSSAVVESAQT